VVDRTSLRAPCDYFTACRALTTPHCASTSLDVWERGNQVAAFL